MYSQWFFYGVVNVIFKLRVFLFYSFTKVCGRHREWHGCFTLCLDRIHTRGHASNRDLTSAVYKAHARYKECHSAYSTRGIFKKSFLYHRLHFVELVPIIHASNLTQHESSVPIALQQQHNPNLCLNETLSVASVLSGVREVRRNVKSAITSAAHRSSVVQSYRTSSKVYDALADVFLQTGRISQNQNTAHVPFRNSKLTHYLQVVWLGGNRCVGLRELAYWNTQYVCSLNWSQSIYAAIVTQDALGIHGHTLLICTTSATASHLNATMVTLRFASRVFMSSHRSVQVRSQPQQVNMSRVCNIYRRL